MTRLTAWNVFWQGISGHKGWARQWRDRAPLRNGADDRRARQGFNLLVPRRFAVSLCQILIESVAQYGLEII
ncbi:MAG: hypothetical protein WA784_14070 [Albidovulum sp.]